MKGLTVIHALPDLRRSAGGIAAMLPALIKALAENGVESRVLGCLTDPADPAEVSTVASGLSLAHSTRSAVDSILSTIAPGVRVVCHSHGLWHRLNHALVQSARESHLPLVVSPHGMLMPWARQNKKWRKDLAWHCYQKADLATADAIHATSEAEAAATRDAMPIQRIAVIPFGVTLLDPNPLPAPVPSESSRTLLFLGRVHPIKNLIGLIDAFASAGVPNCQLLIVGPDEVGHCTALAQRAEALGVRGRVHFEGPLYGEEKRQVIARVDALVLPSFSENYGAVVAEALSLGRPVIASTGTPWSMLESEGCGWWVSPDPEGIARAISKFSSTSRDDLHKMGQRGRAYAERELTWAASAAAMKSLYQSCLG